MEPVEVVMGVAAFLVGLTAVVVYREINLFGIAVAAIGIALIVGGLRRRKTAYQKAFPKG